MKQIITGLFTIILALSLFSCGNSGSPESGSGIETITQAADGSISLKLEEASFYNSKTDPSCNTAEWNFVVSKPGRYNVWLSSATKDTMNLQYKNSVRITLLDERLEAKPVGDRIVLNAHEVKHPWYRADSYMGSVNIEEPGEYSIQVISEKVIEANNQEISLSGGETRMMSVILTPMKR